VPYTRAVDSRITSSVRSAGDEWTRFRHRASNQEARRDAALVRDRLPTSPNEVETTGATGTTPHPYEKATGTYRLDAGVRSHGVDLP